MPDVVTSLIGDKTFSYSSSKRSGVMFCIRNDGEKFYSDDQILSLRKKFIGIKTSVCDTTIFKSAWVWNKQRELLLREILENFSKQQLIITDRYHGTIFSQIVNTPVIVLSSTDHKLSSGVSWFPKMYFEKNVFFAVNLNEAFAIAKQILERKGVIENPSYFRDKYYAGALKV
jgi:exopolysaccharide biosynthesis predicted pyruvyltransferase EpsI